MKPFAFNVLRLQRPPVLRVETRRADGAITIINTAPSEGEATQTRYATVEETDTQSSTHTSKATGTGTSTGTHTNAQFVPWPSSPFTPGFDQGTAFAVPDTVDVVDKKGRVVRRAAKIDLTDVGPITNKQVIATTIGWDPGDPWCPPWGIPRIPFPWPPHGGGGNTPDHDDDDGADSDTETDSDEGDDQDAIHDVEEDEDERSRDRISVKLPPSSIRPPLADEGVTAKRKKR